MDGREPKGTIKQSEYESVRDEVADAIKSIRGPNGEKWDTKVFYPEEIYPTSKGDKPDMMVYLDNMYWRAAGTLGYDSHYLPENDTGPDDAMHSEYGVFMLYMPEAEQKRVDLSIYDFNKIILNLFGI